MTYEEMEAALDEAFRVVIDRHAVPVENKAVVQGTIGDISADQIMSQVCQKYDVTPADLKGPSRERNFAWPRQELYYRLRKEKGWTAPQIGARLNRDHTTVLYGIRAYEERMG